MKKRSNSAFLILLILGLCVSEQVCAQEFVEQERKAAFGINVGYSFNKLVLPENYDGDIQQSNWSASANALMAGVYYEFPIPVLSLSINTNLLVRKTSFATTSTNQNIDTDVLIKLTSLDALVSVRQTFGTGLYKPFIYAGGLFSYQLEDSGKIYEASVQSDQVVINLLSHRELVYNYSIGLGFGAGVHRQLGKRGVSLEARYTTAGHTTQYLKTNQVIILAGFTF